MFFFEGLTGTTIFFWVFLLVALIFINEIARRSMWASIGLFIVLPVYLTLFVWPNTITVEGSTVGSWFHWVKIYSALLGCVGFMAIKYIKGAIDIKYVKMFPPFILAINILEAVVRELQVSSFSGIHDGMFILGGPWNYVNAVAGILSILTISGWAGIYISKKHKDLIWPDMLWFWIIAYTVWNMAYLYNCIPGHAFYGGAAVLLAAAIPAFTWSRGAWLQHRAYTLTIFLMFIMTYPNLVDVEFAVDSSYNPTAMWTLSILSLIVNVAVFGFYLRRIIKFGLKPLHDEIYRDLDTYR
jgi:hypothetical protein